jgi:hypothetical protein
VGKKKVRVVSMDDVTQPRKIKAGSSTGQSMREPLPKVDVARLLPHLRERTKK